ncbi:MAG: nuclear transport factor 2 family protein [Burkholderiaceae bacterium]
MSTHAAAAGAAASGRPTTAAPSSDLQAAIAVVGRFLAALEARRVDEAQACLAESARIVGPGGRPASSVADMVANSSRRYQRIGKHIEHYDAMTAADGSITVYCLGTLHGVWPDGSSFDGIRFIDRFELRDGRITRQDVWNDSAEHRLRRLADTDATRRSD